MMCALVTKPAGKRKAEINPVVLAERSKRRQTARFKYESLPPEHIRILQVTCEIKRNGCQSLSTKLRHFHIKCLPHFMALSYAWAKEGGPARALACNNCHITISTHVYAALENLCSPEVASSFAIWIDAICIDQANEVEKGRQVPHMGSVYTLASQTVVWLGENRLMDKYRQKIEYLGVHITSVRVNPWEMLSKPPFPPYGHEIWVAISSIKKSRWFRRGWVIQEVCLARTVGVLSGRCFLSRSSIHVLWGRDMTRKYHLSIDQGVNFQAMRIYRSEYKATGCDWTNIRYIRHSLEAMRHKLVSKPIDKIYGILSLMPDSIQ